MPGLFASLRTASDALAALQESVVVSQNNVANASTPGYVRQRLHLSARSFSPAQGLIGGVSAGEIQSSRDEFAEHAVRQQATLLGKAKQDVVGLTRIENAFALNDASGVPAALDRMLGSFSAWSVAPNNVAARQNVLSAAASVAQSFQRSAATLAQAGAEAERELAGTVTEINHLAGFVARYNRDRVTIAAGDAGADAQLHVTLERLSELSGVQALKQDNGSITLLLGGQVPLVVGDSKFEIAFDLGYNSSTPPVYTGAPPTAYILNSHGQDVSSYVSAGKLGSLLEVKNKTLPALTGSAMEQGSLNVLAQKVADRVNQILAAGHPSPVPLFTYGSNPLAVSQSLGLNPAITPGLLQAEEPGPPLVSNGKPLALAALANPVDPADKIDGFSLIGYFAQIGADVGRSLSEAKAETDSRTNLATQARSLRSELSGISLDEEAVRLVEFQRAYQASARMVTILDELTQITINIGR